MPYAKITDLPPEVREQLTEDEQRIWLEVWNRVYEQTQDEEKAFQAAWGAVNKVHVKAALGLKSASDGGMLVVGWGMLFDDGDDPDLHRQFFTEATELLSEQYADAPLFYDHGGDPAYGSKPIGQRSSLETYPHGVWVEHRLFPDHPQYLRTLQEVRDGLLFYSGDTFHHLIQNDFNPVTGEIGFWPAAGWSLVRDPAEPGLGPVSLKELAAAAKAARERNTRAGSGRDVPADNAVAETQGTREAFVSGAAAQSRTDELQAVGAANMEQLLQLLAQFFGVDPTPEAVAPLLDEFITWLSGEETASAKFAGLDLGAVKAAFELPAEADNAALVEKFSAFKMALTPPTYNYDLLKQGAALVASATRSAPAVPDPIPYQTSVVRAPGGKIARHSPYVNKGAEMPGLADLVVGMLSRDSKQIAAATKSAGVSQSVTGGYVARREISDTLIEPLFEQEVVMAAGAQIERMDGFETLSVYKDLSNIQAYWAGEHQVVGQSTPKFGVVHLSLRELVAEVRVSQRLLKSNRVNLEARLREQMVRKMRLRMDKSFLLGEGVKPAETGNSGAEPLGILYIPNVGAKTLDTNGKYPQFSDLGVATKALKAANIDPSDTWAWIVHSSLAEDLNDQTDTTGQPLMRENWAGKERPTWRSYPYYETNQIPTNLTVGTNSDNSLIFFGDWQYCVVGLGMDVEIAVNDSTYFRERDVLIQAVAMVDFGVFYPSAFYILKGARVRA